MAHSNADNAIFAATLFPYRSLSRRGFVVLLFAVGSAWFGISAYFWSIGAWPILGFAGLDFFAIWLAFHVNYRAARAYEEIIVHRAALVIRKVAASGRMRELSFNPAWVRLEVEKAGDDDMVHLSVRARDIRVPVGSFLNPADRTSFARAFGAALAEARR